MRSELSLSDIVDALTRKIEEIEVSVMENSELKELTRRQIYYLDIINQIRNPTLGELARKLGLSKPSITMIVEKLVQAGYVIKVQCDEDRRISRIHMGEKGETIAKLHDDVHSRIEAFLTTSLSDLEVKQLIGILNKAVQQ
ncbi:MarR family transcriptional regulator [bacterium]|nr:MarR family transcriptional regulator [bacterium]